MKEYHFNEDEKCLYGKTKRQFNINHQLPSPEDITKLNEFMNKELENLNLDIKSKENYSAVCKLSAAKTTIYNRRRPGEVENLK